jgi:hypothetical protein
MNLDIEFIQENTKVLRGITIPSPLTRGSRFQFVAIAEDMDAIDRTHIFEGQINIGKLHELAEDEKHERLQGLFGTPAWEAAQKAKHLHSDILITASRQGIHSEIHGPLEEASDKVLAYPTNQERLIVTTLHEGWHIGVMMRIMDTIHTAISKNS